MNEMKFYDSFLRLLSDDFHDSIWFSLLHILISRLKLKIKYKIEMKNASVLMKSHLFE